jgi:hypothetical protein
LTGNMNRPCGYRNVVFVGFGHRCI